MGEDIVYSSDIMYSPPYRKKIMGHLFTQEAEIAQRLGKLEEQVLNLTKVIACSTVIQSMPIYYHSYSPFNNISTQELFYQQTNFRQWR